MTSSLTHSKKLRVVSTTNIVSLLSPSYQFCFSLFPINASLRRNSVWYQKALKQKEKVLQNCEMGQFYSLYYFP